MLLKYFKSKVSLTVEFCEFLGSTLISSVLRGKLMDLNGVVEQRKVIKEKCNGIMCLIFITVTSNFASKLKARSAHTYKLNHPMYNRFYYVHESINYEPLKSVWN